MAVAFVAAKGSVANGLATVQSFTVTPTAQINAGERLVVVVGTSGASSATFSASDNSTQTGTANTYVVDKAVLAQSSGNTCTISCNVTRNVLTTDTVTIVTDTSNTSRARGASLFAFTGVSTAAGYVDTSANGTGTTAAFDSTAGATATIADVAIVGGGKYGGATTATPGNNGQGTTMVEVHDLQATHTTHSEYCLDSRLLAYKATGTWANSGSAWYYMVVVYKGVAAATVTPPRPLVVNQAVNRAATY